MTMTSVSRILLTVRFLGVLCLLVPTGIAAAACTGDCDGDGAVTVTELIKGVNIALESASLDACPAFDANGDGTVTVNEIVAAVNYALTACPVEEPTATPTDMPTATPTPVPPTEAPTLTPTGVPTTTPIVPPTALPTLEPTATVPPVPTPTSPATVTATAIHTPLPTATLAPPTPGGATASVQGAAVMVANGMTVIPSVITAIVSGFEYSSSSSLVAEANLEGGAASTGSCPRGGTASRNTSGFPPVVSISLANCAADTADGQLVVNGTASLGLLSPSLNADIQIRFTDDTGTTTKLTQTAKLNGTFSPTLGGSCYATAATLQLSSGTLSSLAPGSNGAGVTFNGTTVNVTVATFNTDCVPVNYSLKFNGPATLSYLAANGTAIGSFDATFSNFDVAQDTSRVPSETRLDGGLNATCVGGAATIATRTPLQQAVGSLCPTDGVLRVTAAGTTGDILYLPSGGVGIDTDLDGTADSTYPSCTDPALLQCVGAT